MKSKNLFLTLLLLANSVFSQPETIKFKHITNDNGLSQSTVYCSLQDRMGYMWFGTQDGLNRYDGYQFKVYKKSKSDPHSIASNFIRTLFEAKDGSIWIGTLTTGISQYLPDRDCFINYTCDTTDKQSNVKNHVRFITQDSRGRIWAGTSGAGIQYFDEKKNSFKTIEFKKLDKKGSNNVIMCGRIDENDVLWLGTYYGLVRFDTKTSDYQIFQQIVGDTTSLVEKVIISMSVPRNNKLWLGLKCGKIEIFDIKTLKINHFTTIDSSNNFSMRAITAVYADSKNRMWFGTFENGLYCYSLVNHKLAKYVNEKNIPTSLLYNLVWVVLEDRNNTLWFGTNNGIDVYDENVNKFHIIENKPNSQNSLSENHTWSIYEDYSGNLYFGSTNGIDIFNPTTKKYKTIRNKRNDSKTLISNKIYVVLSDSKQRFWVGTNFGISCFDSEFKSATNFFYDALKPESIGGKICFAACEDDNKTLWFGFMGGGLNKYEERNRSFKKYLNNPSDTTTISNNTVSYIYKGKNNSLWIGTEMGLNLMDLKTEKFTQYFNNERSSNSLSNNSITSIAEGKDNTLWIGTSDGFNRFDITTHKFQSWQVEQGLPNNFIASLLVDSAGFVWLATNKGISCFNPKSETFRNYEASDGLQSNEFNTNAKFYSSKTGLMYFGGINGINVFNPLNIKDIQSVPQIAITNFKIFNSPVLVATTNLLKTNDIEFDSLSNESEIYIFNEGYFLQRDINSLKKVVLSYREHDFSFELAALHYANTSKNRYKYKLENFDVDWKEIGTQRVANYTNISPGKYIFRVKASNCDGVWNETGISLEIIITPPFWQTWWFRITGIIVIICLIIVYIKYRERELLNKQKHLEKIVAERTEEIQQQKEEIQQQRDVAVEQREMIQEQKEELEITIESLIKTQQHLVEARKMAALGDMVAGVAHEINNPVGICITATSALLQKIKNIAAAFSENKLQRADFMNGMQTMYSSTDLILKNLQRTADLVKSFKQVSVDQASDQKRKFNILNYIKDIVKSLEPKFNQSHTEFLFDCNTEIEIESYPGLYAQLLTNLMINSFIHGFKDKEANKISIAIIVDNEYIIIEYRDNGAGMSNEVLQKMYDPFFTTSKQGGTGLGMSIVYSIVTQRLKGTIECTSQINEGVFFVIKLPLNF